MQLSPKMKNSNSLDESIQICVALINLPKKLFIGDKIIHWSMSYTGELSLLDGQNRPFREDIPPKEMVPLWKELCKEYQAIA